ncbi:MAG TPA: pyridoxal phosphate-dependent aminotransferase [Patescibacteria group bacterium]|nr:pyridoxal phosphate-dependent aminotransferase [Patescibacteria group bacterium]
MAEITEHVEFSHRVTLASESQTLALSGRAKVMSKEGKDVVNLCTGEPDFPTPDCAKKAAIDALQDDFTHYTDPSGIVELRRAVAEKFVKENGLKNATAETILISNGAKQCILSVLIALCNEGDEVIIPAPYWVSYPPMVTIAGAKPVIVETTAASNFKMTPKQLAEALTPQTKCVIFNSPSNPTGVMYTEQEIRALAEVLKDHSCFVISDEIYEKITFGTVRHFSIGSLDVLKDRVVTVNGVSKAYAMTGWRIGFMHAPKEVLKQAAKVQGQTTSNPNSIAQKAALAALLYGIDEVERMRKVFERRRELISTLLKEIPGVNLVMPDGAFYVFPDISERLKKGDFSATDFCEKLLVKHHLALVPGEAFGANGCVRFSFAAADEMIIKGIERFARALNDL